MFQNLLVGSIVIGGIYGLMGLGFSLIYRASGLLSFAQGEFLMLGAFLGLTFFKTLSLPFWLTLLLVIVILFLSGFGMERFIVRPVLRKKGKPIHVVLITIGVSIALQNLALIVYATDVRMFPSIFPITSVNILGYQVSPESILCIIVALVSMTLLHLFMTYTRLGVAMRAAAQDETAASAYGINVSYAKGLTWGLAGALSGIAGMLIGPVYGVHMGMGISISLKGFASAVIGGYGNLYGAILGGFMLGLVETFAGGYLSSQAKDFVSFLVLIIFLIAKPTGIFNARIIEN